MVLYKRKPVQYIPPPENITDNREIWIIRDTDEIFTNYDDYLSRMDYYRQKRFICEITGHSGLDFFSALKNEAEASMEVDDSFPDPMREPILRKVQHSVISRIDTLVDHVYEEFRTKFFVGDEVFVTVNDPTQGKMHGTVREKSSYGPTFWDDGRLYRKGYSRYFVTLTGKPNHEALVDDEHIFRDRKAFTKQMLRSFLKNSLYREPWSGAPWQVKTPLAKEYNISEVVPSKLRQEYQVAQRKAGSTSKKGEYDGTLLNFFAPQSKGLPQLKPKNQKNKTSTPDPARPQSDQFLEYQRALSRNPSFTAFGPATPPSNDPQFIHFINQTPGFPPLAAKGQSKQQQAQQIPPAPPPIKYPREDLELPPGGKVRPTLKYLFEDAPTPERPSEGTGSGIRMESVGLILETWDTLNVYCEVFLLDSFTIDDYIEALQFTSEEVQCELLVEIHCAVLKKLVNDEKDMNGHVQINLPTEDSSEDESTQQSTPAATPTPEPEIQPRTTRGSLAKSEAAELRAQAAIDAKLHHGPEIDQCVRGYGWKARLRKRDFSNCRWIVIIVGLLNLYSTKPRLKDVCDKILAQLAPTSMKPTEETAISQYARLDINLRVQILQILCMLSLDTQAVRSYMEDCAVSMTQFRKEKLEWQKKRKNHLVELKALDEERRTLQPEAASPVIELEELEEELQDEEMKDPDMTEDTNMETEDEDPIPQRSLRRANDRAAERKRKLEEERKRKEKAEADKAKKPTKEARQLEKVMKKIDDVKDNIKECENEIAICDNDLRESDCPRTRVLGKDRFWNRYYWFERNAMPYAGLPNSSTASAGYANGCLWVQGPDDMERVGFIDLNDAENARYHEAFGLTVPERKIKEEGDTHTFTAHQWAYYDSLEDVDKLIAWLSEKGTREVKLRKELQTQREQISTYMLKRKEYLAKAAERKRRSESMEPAPRISTRTKTYVDPSVYRFMAWRNTTAVRELGHVHSEPAKVAGRKGVARVVARKKDKDRGEGAVDVDEGRQTRAMNRQGKPLGRQGTRYNF